VNDSSIAPDSIDQLKQVIVDHQQVIAVGNETKRPLSHFPDATKVSLRSLRGIQEYEPSEFTFTALAGTPLTEIIEALSEKCQYLPFDPMLVDAGATIGGTVAAGLSGPGRFRYGGVRDFILSVHFVSGDGKLIRTGGKVVKNAAGFDIPKFMVGSMGRLGVMTELTFKVFPKPLFTQTLRVQCESHTDAVKRMADAGSSFWELDAIDYRPDELTIYLRIGGPEDSNRAIRNVIHDRWGEDVSVVENANEFWQRVRELDWVLGGETAVKIPVTPTSAIELCGTLGNGLHLTAAANVLWQITETDQQLAELSDLLAKSKLKGLVVRGNTKQCCIGSWETNEIDNALGQAMDPTGKFPKAFG